MNDSESTRIREELAEIKTSVAGLQTDLRRVVFCLLGDLDKPEGGGLLASHAAHAKELSAAQQITADHARRLAALEDSRKWVIAYMAGMMAVLAAAYFLLEHHVNLPKIDVNPALSHEPTK
jgi:hypothetical protein